MSDTSKRRARKSKLVPRDYVDIEDEKNIKMQEPPTKTSKILIKSFDDQKPESSIQFNVEVEVESCDDGDNLVIDESCCNGTKENDIEDDWAIDEISKTCVDSMTMAKSMRSNDDGESLTEYMKFLTTRRNDVLKLTDNKFVSPIENSNVKADISNDVFKRTGNKIIKAKADINNSVNIAEIPSAVFTVAEDEIIEATDDIMKNSDNLADKVLCVEVKNMLGRLRHIPNLRDKYEELIQDALESWTKWFYSKANDPPLFYKCYICNIAWWDLSDFREHIRSHDSITLNVDIEALGEQCCVVAYVEKPHVNIHFSLNSDCWRCGKNFESHVKSYYECSGCMLRFKTCISLAEHESSCTSYWFINKYEQSSVNVNRCWICVKRTFFNSDLLITHLVQYHTVRTDRCTLSKTTTCIKCNEKYVMFVTHTCRSKSGRMFCDNCDRRLCSKMLIDIHEYFNNKVTCEICETSLETECMKPTHMLTHTNNFRLVYKCCICHENVLFNNFDTYAMKEHEKLMHKSKKTDKRVRDYDSIIIPAKFVKELPNVTESNEQTEKRIGSRIEQRKRKRLPFIVDKINETVQKPADNSVSATHIPNNITHNIVTSSYTAISKTGEVIKTKDPKYKIKIGKIFSNFNDNIYDDNKNVKVEVESPTTVSSDTTACKNSDENELSINLKLTNDIIENAMSSADIVIKKEIITDDDNSIINEKTQELNNVDNIIENVQINNIKTEIMSDNEDTEQANELTSESDNKINEEIHSHIQIKQEILDTDYDQLNYEIKIEESDSSISKVFRVSDHLKELTSKMVIKEEFDESMLKNAQFEDVESSMFEPQVIINSNKAMNPVIYCGSCDFKGTIDQFKDHEMFCDSPELSTYRRQCLKVYTCVSCDFKGTHAEFKEHKNDCYNAKKVKLHDVHHCSKCTNDFPSMRHYILHLSEHGIRKKRCPECNMQFQQNTALKHHIINEHIKNLFLTVRLINSELPCKIKMYQCKLCQDKFCSKDFFAHWEKHLVFKDTGNTSAKANVKRKNSDEQISVNDTKVLEPDILKTVIEFLQNNRRKISTVCIICDRFFDRKHVVKRHLVEHLLNDALLNKHKYGALVCQICGDMFLGSTQYKSHMRDHGDLPVYKCEMCNKCFSDSSNFTKHKKVHNISVLVCDLCKRKFQVKETLIKHIKMHDHSKPQNCTLCKTERTFYDNTAFRRHVRSHHNKVYTCRLCKTTHNSLKEKWDHLWLVHKERKTVSDCPVCGESFRRYMDVKKHTQIKHEKEWAQYSKSFRSIFEIKNRVSGTNIEIKSALSDSNIHIKSRNNETLVVFE